MAAVVGFKLKWLTWLVIVVRQNSCPFQRGHKIRRVLRDISYISSPHVCLQFKAWEQRCGVKLSSSWGLIIKTQPKQQTLHYAPSLHRCRISHMYVLACSSVTFLWTLYLNCALRECLQNLGSMMNWLHVGCQSSKIAVHTFGHSSTIHLIITTKSHINIK